MLNLLEKLMGKKAQSSEPGEVKCLCGEVVMSISCEKKDVYFCNKCNRLLYYLDLPDMSKTEPFGLSFFKKKNKQ